MKKIRYDRDITSIAVLQLVVFNLAFADFKWLTIASTLFAFCVLGINVLIKKKANKYVVRFLVVKLLFIIWAFSSCLWSVNASTSANYSITLCLRLLLSLAILLYVDKAKKLDLLLKMLVFAATVLCIRILVTVPFSAYGEARIGQYLSFNEDSSYGNTGITYVLGVASVILFLSDNKIVRNILLRYALILAFTVLSLFSGSKKQIILLLAAIILMVIKKSKRVSGLIRNSIIALVFLGLFLFLVFYVDVFYNSIGVRLESMLAYFFDDLGQADKSTINRVQYIKYAWEVFLNHPINGIGLDGFQYVNPITQCWAECNFVELLADLGIIGFVLYYIPHLIILRGMVQKFRTGRGINYVLVALMAAIFIIDATMVSYRNVTLQLWLAVALSIFIIDKKIDKNALPLSCTSRVLNKKSRVRI